MLPSEGIFQIKPYLNEITNQTMQFGLLRYSYSNNIGDEIQSIAAERFLPRVDLSIERDRLHWYKNRDSITVPFNGWFTRPPFTECWPPPPEINPIFTSWYAVTPDQLINQETASYFKKFEPIGCRSIPTIKYFEKLGITAYHSGCLTLTLPESREPRTDNIYIVDVDPNLVKNVIPESIRSKAKTLTHLTPTGAFSNSTGWSAIDYYMKCWNRMDRNMKVFRQHRERLLHARHEKRMQQARTRLAVYGKAKLVITSLLHCSMPCLALGTPVILIKPDLDTNPRFEGLKELVRYRSNGTSKVLIDWHSPEPNGDNYKQFAKQLSETVSNAVTRALDAKSH